MVQAKPLLIIEKMLKHVNELATFSQNLINFSTVTLQLVQVFLGISMAMTDKLPSFSEQAGCNNNGFYC